MGFGWGNEMTDTTQTNGPLSDHQMQALSFTFADHLRVKGELDNANDEIAELRVRLAETEAKLKAMYEHNAFLEDRLNLATTDRTLAMNQRAEYAVRLKMLEAIILEKPPETLVN